MRRPFELGKGTFRRVLHTQLLKIIDLDESNMHSEIIVGDHLKKSLTKSWLNLDYN